MLQKLLEKSYKSVKKVLSDGVYDRATCRHDFLKRNIESCIPTRRKRCQRVCEVFNDRNCAIRLINLLGGGEVAFGLWKKLVGYHKQSLVETTFSSRKRLFKDRLNNKTLKNLEAETIYLRNALNRLILIQDVT